jgi:hypothetical protein
MNRSIHDALFESAKHNPEITRVFTEILSQRFMMRFEMADLPSTINIPTAIGSLRTRSLVKDPIYVEICSHDPNAPLPLLAFLIEVGKKPGTQEDVFNGRQIHATETGGDWPEQTYLYQDEDVFWFEQYNPAGRRSTIHTKSDLKEHVTKLIPILFTPEELKQLVKPAKK